MGQHEKVSHTRRWGFQEERREKRVEERLEDIMTEKFPSMVKTSIYKFRSSANSNIRINTKKIIPNHQTAKSQSKEKIL